MRDKVINFLQILKNEVNDKSHILMRDYQIKAEFIIMDEKSLSELKAIAERNYINCYEQREPTCDKFMGLNVAIVRSTDDFKILEVK